MRVLVAPAAVGNFSATQVAEVLGNCWSDQGAQVAVVPMAEGGAELKKVLAQLGFSNQVVDLRQQPADIPKEAIGIVSQEELEIPLVGLYGVAARSGRDNGLPIADVLAEDDRLLAWARKIWPDNPEGAQLPGSGAQGGAGLVVLAAGGRLTTAVKLCSQTADLANTARQADLLVTSCDVLDYGNFGGPVVGELLEISAQSLRPLVVFTRRNYISARELRSAGIEAAHEIGDDDLNATTFQRLTAAAQRMARSWYWD